MVLQENMAVEEEEEAAEYESDPEDLASSLALRRREASDDEEGDGDGVERRPRIEIASDGESDGQGGAAVYDDGELEQEEEEEEDEVEELEQEEEEEEEFEERCGQEGDKDVGQVQDSIIGPEITGDEQLGLENKDQEEGDKKENEPFAVPTAGAFYMHDDRFRENGARGGGRGRRTPGGRKLWESKDDRKWGHDKFEEMNLQGKSYDMEGRNLRGQYRGRVKNRGLDRRHARGDKPGNIQNQTVRTVRGRGPRRYEPPGKNYRETPTQNQQTRKFHESSTNTSSGRVSTNIRMSNVRSDSAPARKHVFASGLSSASPPFYPSGSSNQDISQTQNRELPGGNANKNLQPSVMSNNKISSSHSTTLFHGKNAADVAENIYFDDEPHAFYGKFNNLQLQSSGHSTTVATQSSQIKSKGRSLPIPAQPSYHSELSNNQASRVSQQTQVSTFHQRSVQPSFRASSQQQSGQYPSAAFQALSLSKASSTSSSEHGEMESPPGSSKSNTALVGKGKATIQGNGRGSLLYNGQQVMGASSSLGISHGDPNFPGAPALLQVMQFGGQHHGGLGVPAVGMAQPGYVAQPGFGNSEMTWVPVLAGAAGALGGSYGHPYLAVDGGFYSRTPGQTASSGVSSKETSTSKANNVLQPAHRSELVNDEFGQRQNKPRRYSEMSFGQ